MTLLLTIHSLLRWLALFAVLARAGVAAAGLAGNRPWGKLDQALGGAALGIFHTQVLVGLGLLAVSPVFHHAISDMGAAMKDATLRFYAVEHPTMMLLAAVAVTLGHLLARRAATDARRHQIALAGFALAELLVLAAIPWPFRADLGRPWLTLAL